MKLDVIRSEMKLSSLRSFGVGSWAILMVLVSLLVAAAIIGYLGWTSTDTEVPVSGYVAMALGVLFSLGVGAGLMALLFYSSRAGYDEPAKLIEEPDSDQDQTTPK